MAKADIQGAVLRDDPISRCPKCGYESNAWMIGGISFAGVDGVFCMRCFGTFVAKYVPRMQSVDSPVQKELDQKAWNIRKKEKVG